MVEEQVIELYRNPDAKVRDIVNQTNTSIGEIYRILCRNGSKPTRQAPKHGLVVDLVEKFVAEQSSYNVSDIAEITGYTPRNIRYILKKYGYDLSRKSAPP